MSGTPPQHDIEMEANRGKDNEVSVTGNGEANLPRGSGQHRFKFALIDNTGLNVRFASLDTEDNSTSCPPSPGENSEQICGVTMNNNGNPNKTAGFTDRNNNQGQMNVSYQWNFTCDDPSVTVKPFDPIIINGGL